MPDIWPPSPAATSLWLCWGIETMVMVALLALGTSLATRLPGLARRPAIRHALWLVLLVRFATPPLGARPWSLALVNPWDAPPVADTPRQSDQPTPPTRRPLAVSPPAPRVRLPRKEPPAPFDRQDVASRVSATPPAKPPVPPEAKRPAVDPLPDARPADPVPDRQPFVASSLPPARSGGWIVLAAWLAGSTAFLLFQAVRIVRFRRQLRLATPAPPWILREAADMACQLGIRSPRLLVTSQTTSPHLWCLGRPVLLLPRELLDTLSPDAWRGILAHEFAHLRRGDHWVSRLELLTSLAWWWNPLYWGIVRQLDAEAELACDAWVVASLPDLRLRYAETLVEICEILSVAPAPAPSLGAAGAGRFLERRLTMILNEHVPCRLPVAGSLAATLLTLLALPGWLVAGPATPTSSPHRALTLSAIAAVDDDSESKPEDERAEAEDEAEDADDDDDDSEGNEVAEELEHHMETIGEDFGRRMEALGERLASLLEARLGPGSEFEKSMESLGEELEQLGESFGTEFEKKFELLGEEFEGKFGPEIEQRMQKFADEFEKNIGPSLQKRLEVLGRDLEKTFGPEFQKSLQGLGTEIEREIVPEIEQQLESLRKEFSKELGSVADGKKRLLKGEEDPRETVKESDASPEMIAELRAARAAAAEARDKAREAEKKAHEIEARVAREAAKRAREQEAIRAQADRAKAEADRAKAEADRAKAKADAEAAAAKSKADTPQRAARIQLLEQRLKEIAEELDRLKQEAPQPTEGQKP